MFILTKFQDLVQIPPHEFYKLSRDEIEDKINEKYANKVYQKIGLCICLWDLTKASDGLVGVETGSVNVNIEFRMIVFRPFKGEIIKAVIGKCTREGIQVHTEFFEDIFVPKTMLFEGSEYIEEEDTWVWRVEDSGDLYFDKGTNVHIRIESEKWEDLAPNGPDDKDGVPTDKKRKVPYSIEASMAEQGLGGADWW